MLNENVVNFPNGNIICRAKVSTNDSKKIYLAGEVVGNVCAVGWNQLEYRDIFEVLYSKCLPGSELSWHLERKEMESVLDEIMVYANDITDPIGICDYNGNFGWKRGRS